MTDLSKYATETGLIKPTGLTQPEYMDVGRFLAKAKTCLQWAIGDWYNHCPSTKFPYQGYREECCRQVGLNPESARRYSIVCKQYPPEIRIPGLSFGHHQTAGGIEDVNARTRLLTQAQDQEWSVAKLKDETIKLLPAPKKRHQKAKTTAQRIKGLLDSAHGVGGELHALALLESVSEAPPSKETRDTLSALRSLEADVIDWRSRLGDRQHTKGLEGMVTFQVAPVSNKSAAANINAYLTHDEYRLVMDCLASKGSATPEALAKAHSIMKRVGTVIEYASIPLNVARLLDSKWDSNPSLTNED